MAKITLPDGTELTVNVGATVKDVALQIGPGLAKVALAGRVDDKLVDLTSPLAGDAALQIITPKDPIGLELIASSAVLTSWPRRSAPCGLRQSWSMARP